MRKITLFPGLVLRGEPKLELVIQPAHLSAAIENIDDQAADDDGIHLDIDRAAIRELVSDYDVLERYRNGVAGSADFGLGHRGRGVGNVGEKDRVKFVYLTPVESRHRREVLLSIMRGEKTTGVLPGAASSGAG